MVFLVDPHEVVQDGEQLVDEAAGPTRFADRRQQFPAGGLLACLLPRVAIAMTATLCR